jgi:hypothetical protein
VKTGVDVDARIAAAEDVLEGRKIDRGRERDDCGGDEKLGP